MVDITIIKFFRKHHVLTIATTVENEPWCANCFYVYLEEENMLVFTTDADTRHGKEFVKNPLVAGSVVLETMVIGKIRGIQFQGIISEPEGRIVIKSKMGVSQKISSGSAHGYSSLGRKTYSY